MGRIIIATDADPDGKHIRSNLSGENAIIRVARHALQDPQVGGRAYLAAALYADDVVVTHDENKASHKFTLFNKQPKEEK